MKPSTLGFIIGIMASMKNFFLGSIPRGNTSHTPHIPNRGHYRQPKHRVKVPNGKWMMKAHRGRAR